MIELRPGTNASPRMIGPPRPPPTYLGRRRAIEIQERRPEAAQAFEPGALGNLRDRQIGIVQQPLGPLQANRHRGLHRARADMTAE